MTICYGKIDAQAFYGTTGLLHMPTADMQRDKTFMFGSNYLNYTPLSTYWKYNTYNYYVNITFFPWLEVAYTCTLVKGAKGSYWPEKTWGKFVNQDRNFSARLRLWKESWWKTWTPQIVLGTNDPASADNNGGGNLNFDQDMGTHNYFNRFYLVATKHVDIKKIGTVGVHAAYIVSRATGCEYEGPAIGVNFQFALPATTFANKALNGLNLMAEYDSRTVNMGLGYAIWKDHINFIGELNDFKYLSAGVCFKVHLK